MKAIKATGYGSPDVLKLSEAIKPTPANHDVLVRIIASSATAADTMMRTGKPLFGRLILGLRKPNNPIPGTGFAGVVEEVGSAVTSFKKGDQVFGETTIGFGANAEYLTIPEHGVIHHLPANLNYADAATYCDGVITSYNFLKRVAQVQVGERVLINGASGSLGTAAVQIAHYLGAEVTAVCSSRNAHWVTSLGAHHVIEYDRNDFTQSHERYDVVFDTVGKSSFSACKSILTPNGKYLSPVLSLSTIGSMLWTSIVGKQKAIFQATGMQKDPELKTLLNEVLSIHRDGKLKIVIDRQYPLEKLAEAHRYIETGRKKGNVVIINA
ncbi:MAG: NAD(P)-dependent alcohol dehydrogenase [Bacteroidetes bacterium]|nr:NAD(P)-dependent alcohol dehydrogenase [Bacteroidota bacterium]